MQHVVGTVDGPYRHVGIDQIALDELGSALNVVPDERAIGGWKVHMAIPAVYPAPRAPCRNCAESKVVGASRGTGQGDN